MHTPFRHKSYSLADTARTTEPSYPDLQIHEDLTARVTARPLLTRDEEIEVSDDDADDILSNVRR